MRNNIAAVTVLYNPDKIFIENIKTYLEQVGLLILIDNSEIPDSQLYDLLLDNEKVKLITYHTNNGIAKAMNDGIHMAIQHGSDWVLTMDQDSYFERAMIEKYLDQFDALPDRNKTAVIGPLFEPGTAISNAAAPKQVASLITSGSLVNTAIFTLVGGFNEALFIDEVDHEYCYRARLKGYDILQLQDIFMLHTLGRQVQVTTITGKKNRTKVLHSPIRLYYIARNSCYVIARYKKQFPDEMKLKKKDVLVRIKNNFLYGPNKVAIIKYVFRGYVDFLRGRMGKY